MSSLPPYARFETERGQVAVDIEILDHLASSGLTIGFVPENPYPWVFSDLSGRRVRHLHNYVLDYYASTGARRRRMPSEVVHHKNHDKHDARGFNLEILTKKQHALTHKKEKQKTTPRKRDRLSGLYRPRAPGKVRYIQLEATREAPKKQDGPLPIKQQVRDALLSALPALQASVGHRDSGKPIPRMKPSGSKQLRSMGVRLGLTDDEAALVGLVIEHGRDPLQLEAALGVPSCAVALHGYFKLPAVDLALTRWRQYRRVPKQLLLPTPNRMPRRAGGAS